MERFDPYPFWKKFADGRDGDVSLEVLEQLARDALESAQHDPLPQETSSMKMVLLHGLSMGPSGH